MRILELAVTLLSALPVPHAFPAASGIEQCSDVVVEVVGVEGEPGRELGVVRITNRGGQPRDYEVYGPSPELGVPVLHINHYSVYWLEPNASSWKYTFTIGEARAGRGTVRIEPGESKLMVASIAKPYEPDAPPVEAIMIDLKSRKPQCETRSGSVRLSELRKYPSHTTSLRAACDVRRQRSFAALKLPIYTCGCHRTRCS